MAEKIKKGDQVIILSGRDKGKKGAVQRVFLNSRTALIEGVNIVTRHEKSRENKEGGRISKSLPIALCKVALLDPKDGLPTRVGFKLENGSKVRISKRSGECLDVAY
jgi:large subunit ribosomal protein L24